MKLRNKKTGKIGELSGVNRIVVYEPNIPLCGNSILGEYDTLAELTEEWEDYKPAEPLIEDEKIRKAVRAWAETNQSKFIIRNGNYTASDNRGLMIEFNKSWTTYMENDKQYTITELCGDEE